MNLDIYNSNIETVSMIGVTRNYIVNVSNSNIGEYYIYNTLKSIHYINNCTFSNFNCYSTGAASDGRALVFLNNTHGNITLYPSNRNNYVIITNTNSSIYNLSYKYKQVFLEPFSDKSVLDDFSEFNITYPNIQYIDKTTNTIINYDELNNKWKK